MEWRVFQRKDLETILIESYLSGQYTTWQKYRRSPYSHWNIGQSRKSEAVYPNKSYEDTTYQVSRQLLSVFLISSNPN